MCFQARQGHGQPRTPATRGTCCWNCQGEGTRRAGRGRRQETRVKALRALTVSERVQVTKYPETIVGPFRGHSQLLQRSSCLRAKKKKCIKIILDVTGTRGESKALGQVGRGFSLRGGWGMGCDGGRGKEQTKSEMRWNRCCREGKSCMGDAIEMVGQNMAFPSHLEGEHQIQGSFSPCLSPGRPACVK